MVHSSRRTVIRKQQYRIWPGIPPFSKTPPHGRKPPLVIKRHTLNEIPSYHRGSLRSTPPLAVKAIAILGDRWWPHTAKQQGDKISKSLLVTYGEDVMSAQMLEVSIRSRKGSPSRKGCVVNGEMTQGKQHMSTPPPCGDVGPSNYRNTNKTRAKAKNRRA